MEKTDANVKIGKDVMEVQWMGLFNVKKVDQFASNSKDGTERWKYINTLRI